MRRSAITTWRAAVKRFCTESSETWTVRRASPTPDRALSTTASNSSEINRSDVDPTSGNSHAEVPTSFRIAGWSLAAATAGLAGVVAYVTNKYSQEEIVQKVAAMQKDSTPKPFLMVNLVSIHNIKCQHEK